MRGIPNGQDEDSTVGIDHLVLDPKWWMRVFVNVVEEVRPDGVRCSSQREFDCV